MTLANINHETAMQAGETTPAVTLADIRKYICPDATEREAYMFLRLCQAQNLNPFLREAYLVKYGNGPATIIVGKEGFTKRAESHPQFDGFQAGVIVERKDGELDYRQSTFAPAGKIVGGWAEVYRKDRAHPFRTEVSMEEFNTGKSQWAKMPGTMIRKVALVQALREAFPQSFAGLYDGAEMRVDEDGVIEDAPAPRQEARTAPQSRPAVSDATPAPKPASPPVSANPAISEAQRRRLFALSHAAKVNEADLRAYMREHFGIERTSALTQEQYAQVERWLNEPRPQPAASPTTRQELRAMMNERGITPNAIDSAFDILDQMVAQDMSEADAIAQVWKEAVAG